MKILQAIMRIFEIMFMGLYEPAFTEAFLYGSTILFYCVLYFQYRGIDWVGLVSQGIPFISLYYLKGCIDYWKRTK